MIDHKNKLIFIHIPKTSGISIQHLLFGQKIYNPHRKSLHLLNNLDGYQGYTTFTVVRNPLDRLVSVYYHYIQGGNASRYDKEIGNYLKDLGFRKFILNLDNLEVPHYDEIEYMLYSQTYYIYRNGKKCIDLIFHFEELSELSFYLSTNYDLPSLPHLNKSQHKDYLSYYDNEMISSVKNRHASDFNLLGYI